MKKKILIFVSVLSSLLILNTKFSNNENNIDTTSITTTITTTTETTTETTTMETTNPETIEYIRKKAIVTYYTHLPQCTGDGDGITASGTKVSETSVAIPRKDNLLNFGDTIIFESLSPKYMEDYNGNYLTRIADDTGNPNYIKKIDDETYRLDVFCPKLPNESNEQYYNRVLSYGKTETNILIKNN